MSTPNPLIPQGTFQPAANVRLAVATIVAIHLVFFGGLLSQGCKRDAKTGSAASTNTNANAAATNLSLPALDSNSLYYTNPANLPAAAATNLAAAGSNQAADLFPAAPLSNFESWQPTNLNTALAPQAAPLESGGTKDYTVLRGDTLGKIAKAHGTTLRALQQANPGVDPARLRLGMKLIVPLPAPAAPATQASGVKPPAVKPGTTATTATAAAAGTYTVKPGDTLTRIARQHGTTVGQLRAANNLRTAQLKVGQKLKIPAQAKGTTIETSASGAGGPTNAFNPAF